jgi:hypothetical protein
MKFRLRLTRTRVDEAEIELEAASPELARQAAAKIAVADLPLQSIDEGQLEVVLIPTTTKKVA